MNSFGFGQIDLLIMNDNENMIHTFLTHESRPLSGLCCALKAGKVSRGGVTI